MAQIARESSSPASEQITGPRRAAEGISQVVQDINVSSPGPQGFPMGPSPAKTVAAKAMPVAVPYGRSIKIPYTRRTTYIYPDAFNHISLAHRERYRERYYWLRDLWQRTIEESSELSHISRNISYELQMCGPCLADAIPSIVVFCPLKTLKKLKSLLTQHHIISQFKPETTNSNAVTFGLFFWGLGMWETNEATVVMPEKEDEIRTYEGVLLAARDYTNSRMEDMVRGPGYIARPYSAVNLISGLLSAGQVDKGGALNFREKPPKLVRIPIDRELTHALPGMFTQVLLLSKGSDQLDASIVLLRYAYAVASKIPGWTQHHPVRRILSNVVVLSRSEDPSVVSQVAENARKSVLDNCNDSGLCSRHDSDLFGRRRLPDELEHLQVSKSSVQKIRRTNSGTVDRPFDTEEHPIRPGRIINSERIKIEAHGDSEDDLQREGMPQHTVWQLNRDRGKDSTSNIGHGSPCVASPIGAAADTSTSANLGLGNPVPTDARNFETNPVQHRQHATTYEVDGNFYPSSAGSRVLVSREKVESVGNFDRVRLCIEKILGEELDWRPLPPINYPKRDGQSRISWTYNGITMSILVDKSETPSQVGRGHRRRTDGHILPTSELTLQLGTSESTSATGSTRFKDLSWKQIRTWLFKKAYGGSMSPSGTDPGEGGTTQKMESYLCVDKCWSSIHDTRMTTVDSVECMRSDYDYFRQARHILSKAEGTWLQRKLSWRSYTRFHFLFDNNNKVDAIDFNTQASLGEICPGYEFERLERFDINDQMRILAKILLEGIRNPELGRGRKTLVNCMPKLKAPPGIKKKAMEPGWGFHARHGLSLEKILSWVTVILVLGLGFVPFWLSSIDKLDVQSALAPASFLVTVVALWVAVLAITSGSQQ